MRHQTTTILEPDAPERMVDQTGLDGAHAMSCNVLY